MRRIPTKLNQKCKCKMIFVQTWSKYLNLHYLVPLSAKFYQFFILTNDFDTDLFLSTSCSQLISGESLVSFIHSTHIHMRAFALIPPKRLEIATSFWVSFFSTFFFKRQHFTEKNQNKCLTLQLDSCNYSQNLLVWASSSKNIFFTADSHRKVVVQM